MELQQHFSVSANEYEESEGDAEKREMRKNDAVKTEDLYQSLHFPPTAHHGAINSTTLVSEHREIKYVFLLFAVNILISAIILVIVGLNYTHNTETQPIKGQKEMWLHRDNVFYLFWSDHSDCSTAQSFCSERNASLAILTEHNKVWLMSRTNGKQFLVSRASSDGSGDIDVPSVDDEDRECGIMTDDVDIDHGEGFVCERRVNPIG
ncbi:hypothetical protein cypCar_00027583 [Cyprinus carpio]|uniref:Uncharacterized protein LOC109073814 isoform X1 n=2 Tax=Cyprinus carpio TaxID=7962 RepID=A0A9Q9Y2F6_CYPCA|nr:uncharacterized protein LOC109073814 isoform X1 [Cyprinus carpio]KTF87015.1 hypothetical protein cypCar_00027583 [Cyprinus carpio]